MKPSRRRSGDSSSARSGGTIVTWLHMQEKLRDALGLRALQRQRGRRRRRLEADREEDDLAIGVLLGDPQRVERRVDHADVGALRPSPRAACRREPGTRIMSPKQVKITPGSWAIAMPSSTRPIGITQTGQPGPVDELDVLGQQVVDAVLVDRVRVPAADLHQLVVAAGLDGGEDLAGERPGRARRRGTRRRTSCDASDAARRRRGRAPRRRARPAPTSSISTVLLAAVLVDAEREPRRASTCDARASATASSPQVMQWSPQRQLGAHSITLAFSSSSSCS